MDVFEGGPEYQKTYIACHITKPVSNMKKSDPWQTHEQAVSYNGCDPARYGGMADPPRSAYIPDEEGEIAPAKKRQSSFQPTSGKNKRNEGNENQKSKRGN